MILYGKALQHAYNLPTYKEAKAELDAIKPELALMNESALSSTFSEDGLEISEFGTLGT